MIGGRGGVLFRADVSVTGGLASADFSDCKAGNCSFSMINKVLAACRSFLTFLYKLEVFFEVG